MNKIKLIYISDEKGLIGIKEGNHWEQPFYLPKDLAHFHKMTSANIVVMGRETFNAMDNKPLPYRTNIVMTKQSDYEHLDKSGTINICHSVNGLFKRIDHLKADIYIIGGANIYEQFLDLADEIIHTCVHTDYSEHSYGEFKYFNPDLSQFSLENKTEVIKNKDAITGKEFEFTISTYKRSIY